MRHVLAHLTPPCLALALSACASMGDRVSGLTAPSPPVATLVPVRDSSGRTMHIVCSSTIDPDRRPLLVVDGRLLEMRDLQALDPTRIETIYVMKGPAAMPAWGPRATDGAIVITMKAAEKG